MAHSDAARSIAGRAMRGSSLEAPVRDAALDVRGGDIEPLLNLRLEPLGVAAPIDVCDRFVQHERERLRRHRRDGRLVAARDLPAKFDEERLRLLLAEVKRVGLLIVWTVPDGHDRREDAGLAAPLFQRLLIEVEILDQL